MAKRKSLAYAYPTSELAVMLGFGKVGCWFVDVVESDDWKVDRPTVGYERYDDPELIASYLALPYEVCPMFLRRGYKPALNATLEVD